MRPIGLGLLKISVIIPTLNEEATVRGTLRSIRTQAGRWEIIVVDGGSTDGTCAAAARFGTVLKAPRGRATQMNTGANAATGDVLLFLHADTCLASGALPALRRALACPKIRAGIFALRFDASGIWPWAFAQCARVPWHRIAFGDRGIFVRRQVFEDIGGFAEIPLFEDLDLVRRLHQRGRLEYLDVPVVTSWRRFARNGPLRQQWHNLLLWSRFWQGLPPEQLAHSYGHRLQ